VNPNCLTCLCCCWGVIGAAPASAGGLDENDIAGDGVIFIDGVIDGVIPIDGVIDGVIPIF